MGILRDWGILIGILPIPRPEPVEFGKAIKINLSLPEDGNQYNKIKKLEELNGQPIWVRDFHYGILNGNLNYIPLLTEKYMIRNCNGSGETKMLHIHDLETIF